MKKNLLIFTLSSLAFFAVVGIVFAAFIDKGKYTGATFSVGSSDLRLLENLALGATESNLKDELQGPTFTNINSNWKISYPIKLYNNGSTTLTLDSRANYETANDPSSLRSYIYAEVFDWNDANNNGSVDTDEKGSSYGIKSFTKWKTEGFALGTINSGTIRGYVLEFSTQTISDTLQGKSGTFDFEFNAAGQ